MEDPRLSTRPVLSTEVTERDRARSQTVGEWMNGVEPSLHISFVYTK